MNLTIRKSKYHNLVLICNSELVYRIFLNGIEKMNNMDYNIVSDYFNELEKTLI
jgi:hypothetical protein